MARLFENRMGDFHVWKDDNDCKSFHRKGLHGSLSTCNGKESDVYIQLSADIFVEDVVSKLPKNVREDLKGGFVVDPKPFNFNDLYAYGN